MDRVARALRVPPLGPPQVVSLAVMALVIVGLVYLLTDAALRVRAGHATIVGARYTPVDLIWEKAAIQGSHVFFVNPARVARRIESLPYVRRATVTVNLPASVHIRVEERRPVLVWERQDGVFWVDEDGVALPALEDRPTLVRLVDREGLARRPGDQAGASAEEQAFDLTVLAGVQAVVGRFPDVHVVYYDTTYGLRIVVPTSAGSVEVILGPLTGVEERLARLPDLLRRLEAQHRRVTRIDLTRPDAVLWEK